MSNVNIPLEELVSSDFNPATLTKPEILSVLQEYSGLSLQDLPKTSDRKDVYIAMFEKFISQRRNELLTPKTRTSRSKKVSFSTSDDLAEENPFQSPRPRRSTPARRDRTKHWTESPKEKKTAKTSPIRPELQEDFEIPIPSNRSWTIVGWVFKAIIAMVVAIYLYIIVMSPICKEGQTQLNVEKLIWAPFTGNKDGFCWKCPDHGICRGNQIECVPGYKRVNRAFGVLYPICRVDLKHQSIVDSLTLAIEKMLGERLGDHLCMKDFALDVSGKDVSYTRDQLYQTFKNTNGPWKNHESFDKYFKTALDRFSNTTTYKVSVKGKDTKLYYATVPVYGIGCRLKKWSRDFVRNYFVEIGAAILLISLFGYVRYLIKRRRNRKMTAMEVLDKVVSKLVEQENLNRKDPQAFTSTLSCTQLRDALLGDMSEKDRRRIWKTVTAEIHKDSNIRESITIIKGEQHRVWEWIGPDILSPRRK